MTEAEKRRVGRPTNDPKQYKITVSFNAEQTELIKNYAIKHSVTKAEAVRQAVNKLKSE